MALAAGNFAVTTVPAVLAAEERLVLLTVKYYMAFTVVATRVLKQQDGDMFILSSRSLVQ